MLHNQLMLLERQYEVLQMMRREISFQQCWWEAQVRQVLDGGYISAEVANGLQSSHNVSQALDDEYEVVTRELASLRMLLEYSEELLNEL